MDQDFDGLYSTRTQASIALERLLRASLFQVIYTFRSERQLVEQFDFDLLFNWLVDGRADVGSLDPRPEP